MRKIQEKLLQLAFEVNVVCDELGIPVALYGKTCASAVASGGFAQDEGRFHLMVPACEIKRLEHALAMLGIPDRAVETLATNGRLSTDGIRYVDASTTLIDQNDATRYEHLGVAVDVHPVYAASLPRVFQLAISSLSYANGAQEYNPSRLPAAIRPAMHAAWSPAGKALMAKMARRALDAHGDTEGAKSSLVMRNGDFAKVKGNPFAGLEEVDFEGVTFKVPARVERFLRAQFVDWRKSASRPELRIDAATTVCDAETPYAEMLEHFTRNGVDAREVQRTLYRNFKWRSETYNAFKARKVRMYRYCLLSRDRIDLCVRLEGKRDELLEASEHGDIERLKELMGDYFALTEKYFRKGLGFFVTQELFDMAVQVWEAQGAGRAHADAVYEIVPAAHKKKDLREYISRYR